MSPRRRVLLAVCVAAVLWAPLVAMRPAAAVAAGFPVIPHQTIRQSRGLDCEAAALVIALSARGIHVSEDWVMGRMPNDTTPAQVDGAGNIIHWGDPYAAFVGNYYGSETNFTGYGVYWPQIARAARDAGAPVVATDHWDPRVLYADVAAGHPAVVWVINGLWGATTRWYAAYDGRSVPYAIGEHAEVLVGVDYAGGRVLLANPWSGRDEVASMARFEGSFAVFGNMAVVVGGGGGAGMAATPSGRGYRIAGFDGSVTPFGDAAKLPDAAGMYVNAPFIGMRQTPTGNGYWLVGGDGGIFPYGDAGGYGSTGAMRLNRPIIGMESTLSGRGYWLVAGDGGIFPFGDARWHSYGSTGNIRLNQPIVGMARTASGNGYWLVASDGGIFPFGDARWHSYGSTGNIRLNRPITAMTPTADGNGYWLLAQDGGVFPFGDAVGYGSTA